MKTSLRRTVVKESDLLVALGNHFAAYGYECYPEMGADLTVYHRGRDELIGIEGKLDLNFKVLDQALHKKHRGAHDAVLICTTNSSIARFWAPKICHHIDVGLGVIAVSHVSDYDRQIYGGPLIEVTQPAAVLKTRDRYRTNLLELMCPEAQVYATPGASGPLGFTEFRMQEVLLYRECLKGPLTVDEAREVMTPKGSKKKIDLKRFLSYFGGAFKALKLEAEHVVVAGPWGSQEIGHSGLQWCAPRPDLAGKEPGILIPATLSTAGT